MKNNSTYKILKNSSLVIYVSLTVFPLVSLIYTSLKFKGIENYVNAITKINLGLNISNSFMVAILTVILILTITLPAGFAFSKIHFEMKNTLYTLILLSLMIPGVCIAIPVTKIIVGLQLINNHLSLVLVYSALATPFFLVLTRSFIDQLPNELIEASIIDGCSTFKAFILIILPLSKPIASIICVLGFLQSWNEFLFAMLFMKKTSLQMVTTVPILFQADFVTNVPAMFAALVLIQLPLVIIFIIFQKAFKTGLTAGAVKG